MEVKQQQRDLTETIEEVKNQKSELLATQKAVLEAINEVKKQQNELYLQWNAVTNLITEANQIKDEIIRLRNDCQNEVNLLRSIVADQGAAKSMETLTQ